MSIKTTLSVRLLIVIGVTALLIALPVMAMLQQPAVAAPPPPLRGPFRFVELPNVPEASAADDTIVWTPLYTQTFDTALFGKPGWQLTVTNAITDTPDQHRWEYVFSSSYPGQNFKSTLWSSAWLPGAQVNYTVYTNSTYLPWMDTWAIYGPLDGQTYRQFQATFSFYLDTNPGAKFGWAASSDGTNFCGQSLSGHIGQWSTATFDLPSCPGDTSRPVYLAFFFQSNGDTPIGLGAFVDNLTISGVTWLKTYFPYFRRDPTPTPSPTPIASPTPISLLVKTWDFNDPLSDSSNEWCSGSTDDWSANKVAMGPNGSIAYLIKSKQGSMLKMLSPLYTTPNNYRITAQFNFLRFNTGYSLSDFGSAQFGLIFAVEGDTFGNDPAPADRCPSDPSAGAYHKFMLKINPGGGGYVTRLERVTNGNWVLLNESSLPSGLSISRTDWNTMTLDRRGNGIVVYINGIQVLNYSDSTNTGGRWFGLFTQTLGNNRDGAFESDWDNIQVFNLSP
jgi:hypothetical protein